MSQPADSDCRPIFPGTTIPRGDLRYSTLSMGFNLRFVGNPDYITLCGDAEQVRLAVQTALDTGRRITVRGGGHCYEDFVSRNNNGTIIDLSPLNGVYRSGDFYCIEGGCTLWNVYTELYKDYGLVLPAGSCYSVGAGGHIIGGGYGLLARKHGLTVDWLDAVELVHVTSDRRAEIITVGRDSATHEERELFWAHRGGGGGNFGIVTKYLFRSLPVPPDNDVYIANIAWNWSDMTKDDFRELVENYGAFFAEHNAPDDPYNDLFALLKLTQKSTPQIVLTAQWIGADRAPLDAFIAAMTLTNVAHVPQTVPVGYHHMISSSDTIQQLTWLQATQTLNGSGPNQRGKYKSAYMIEPFPQEQIDTAWEFLSGPGVENSTALLQVDSYGGMVNALPPDATAVPQRSSIMKLQYQIYWTDKAMDQQNLDWMRAFYNAMYGPNGPMPDGTMDGCYVNYPDVDLIDWEYLYYKESYQRLQQAKLWWDPNNIFNHAQSIRLPG